MVKTNQSGRLSRTLLFNCQFSFLNCLLPHNSLAYCTLKVEKKKLAVPVSVPECIVVVILSKLVFDKMASSFQPDWFRIWPS